MCLESQDVDVYMLNIDFQRLDIQCWILGGCSLIYDVRFKVFEFIVCFKRKDFQIWIFGVLWLGFYFSNFNVRFNKSL